MVRFICEARKNNLGKKEGREGGRERGEEGEKGGGGGEGGNGDLISNLGRWGKINCQIN